MREKKFEFNIFIKNQIIYSLFYLLILLSIFSPLESFCFEPTQTIEITKEDILNAKPVSFYDVKFSKKELKQIEMLEKRHFSKTFDNLLDEERLNNLEKELMGRTWNYTPQKIRLERIGIASSNFMLIGAALPASISSKRNAKRMRNNSIQLKEKDNVGLIDGFLRLINPELYKLYKKESEFNFENYEK